MFTKPKMSLIGFKPLSQSPALVGMVFAERNPYLLSDPGDVRRVKSTRQRGIWHNVELPQQFNIPIYYLARNLYQLPGCVTGAPISNTQNNLQSENPRKGNIWQLLISSSLTFWSNLFVYDTKNHRVQ